MTERLYYSDSALLSFDAQITRIEETDGRTLLFLNRSAFYPTSGGQSHDLGRINDINVVEVVETAEGDVAHIITAGQFQPGDQIRGIIDGNRRLKNRQQHTAQHILSHLLIEKLNAETVSVHLGDDYGAIELAMSSVTEEQLREVEKAATEIIAGNHPIEIMFVSGEEIAKIPLRKQPQREGTIRVIRIGQLDWSACGGTHCCSTAEVGLVKIIGTEKLRGHVLVRFLAGGQALADYCLRFDITDSLAKSMTCHPSDLLGKVEKLVAENKQLRKDLTQAQKELLPARAHELASKFVISGEVKIVAEMAAGIDSGLLSPLASLVATEINGIAMLVCDGRIVIAASESSGLAADKLAREFSQKTGLKGGGNARMAQLGGCDDKKFAEYRTLFLSVVQGG